MYVITSRIKYNYSIYEISSVSCPTIKIEAEIKLKAFVKKKKKLCKGSRTNTT